MYVTWMFFSLRRVTTQCWRVSRWSIFSVMLSSQKSTSNRFLPSSESRVPRSSLKLSSPSKLIRVTSLLKKVMTSCCMQVLYPVCARSSELSRVPGEVLEQNRNRDCPSDPDDTQPRVRITCQNNDSVMMLRILL